MACLLRRYYHSLSESARVKGSCSAALKTQASSTGVSCGPALEVAEANVHFVGPS